MRSYKEIRVKAKLARTAEVSFVLGGHCGICVNVKLNYCKDNSTNCVFFVM